MRGNEKMIKIPLTVTITHFSSKGFFNKLLPSQPHPKQVVIFNGTSLTEIKLYLSQQ